MGIFYIIIVLVISFNIYSVFRLLKIKADKEQFEVVKELVFALEKRIINLEKK